MKLICFFNFIISFFRTISEVPNSSNSSKDEGSLICHICGQNFTNQHHLRRHRLKVHEDMSALPFKCEICDNRFVTKVTLEIHQNQMKHSWKEIGSQKCMKCDNVFENLEDYKIHISQKHHSVLMKNTCHHCHFVFDKKYR